MVLYFLKSTFLLLIFCLIFKWNLENKKSLKFIRYYLLASIVFALVVPLLNFQFLVPQNKIVETKEYIFNQLPDFSVAIIDNEPEKNISILIMSYLLISCVFLIRFLYNVYKILQIKKTGIKVSTSFGNLIVSNKVVSPFTFCNNIYVNDTEWETKSLNPAILYHEQAHVKQSHSIDILFVEALKIVLWFQPFLYYFKRIIQENHEYLADEFSLQRTNNLKNYQELILNYYGNNQPIVALSSSIHFNNLKKRFIMMKNTKKGKVWGTIFYSLTIAVTYVGFVGIETKAAEIKKVEDKISNIIEQSVKKTSEIKFNEPIKEVKNKIGSDSITLAYIKGEKSSGYFNYKESVYFYVVDESLKVSIYNRYGIVQNEKDFIYELKAVSKTEKEKLTLAELKRSSQVQNDYQDRKEIEKNYERAHSFVEQKAGPKEGMSGFMQNFVREFKMPEEIGSNEIKVNLKFIVETDGSFSNIYAPEEYIKPSDSYLALQKEAIRALKTMPNWKPAEHEGKIVRSTFRLPITIRVNL